MNSVIDMYARWFHSEEGCFLFDELLTPERRGKRSEPRAPWFNDAVTFQPKKDLLVLPYSSG